MGADRRGDPGSLSSVEAGEVLGLPADVVRALADAGYLRSSSRLGGVPRFALGDLKAFEARESVAGPGRVADDDLDSGVLLSLVDARADRLADRAVEVLAALLPDLVLDDAARADFVADTRSRIEAILAVCSGGHDAALDADLAAAGAEAARQGLPLPIVLLPLRTSRELVVQAAVEATGDLGPRWLGALAIVLTRVVPAVDHLTDAVAHGWWSAAQPE